MKQLIADCLREVDELLRGERTTPQLLAEQGLNIRARRMVFVVIAMGMIYGLCMGSFSLLKTVPPELAGTSDRYMQVVASVVKTPALFFLTLLVTLPSLYVFNALVGSRLRPLGMFRLLVRVAGGEHDGAGVAGADRGVLLGEHQQPRVYRAAERGGVCRSGNAGADVLAADDASDDGGDPRVKLQAKGPVAAAVDSHEMGDAADDVVLTPVLGSQALEPSAIDMPEGEVFAQHTRTVFRCWVLLFALVGAQMGWVMRPFIGSPTCRSLVPRTGVEFLRGSVGCVGESPDGRLITGLTSPLTQADDILRRAPWTTQTHEASGDAATIDGPLGGVRVFLRRDDGDVPVARGARGMAEADARTRRSKCRSY